MSNFKFREEMRDERVTELDEPGEPPVTRRFCHSVALLTFFRHIDHEDARLCHGLVKDSFGPGFIEHGWVENPGEATWEDGTVHKITVVVDYTQPDPKARFLPLEVFYTRTMAHKVRRFTKAEALRLAKTEPTDGPWFKR